jgi:hypothetical protein
MFEHYVEVGVTRHEFYFIGHLAKFKYETKDGKSMPSMQTVAKEMGYAHVNSCYNLAKSLEEKNMLRIQRRDGHTSIYNFEQFTLACAKAAGIDFGIPLHSNVTPPPQPSVGEPPHPKVTEEEESKE